MAKWTKIICHYFKNSQKNNQAVLEVVNPENGKILYIPLPIHPLIKKPSKKAKQVLVFFDNKWKIRRITKVIPINLTSKNINKKIKEISDLV